MALGGHLDRLLPDASGQDQLRRVDEGDRIAAAIENPLVLVSAEGELIECVANAADRAESSAYDMAWNA